MASTRNNGFIGGGNRNCIASTGTGAAATTFGVIGGGQNNLVIYDYAAVFGNAITCAAPNTLHVECLNAVNTPPTSTSHPVDTIFRYAGGVLPPGALPLYITP